MSESRARSSICRRATTGMFLSPSCSEVTGTPLMALVAELATSMLRDARQVGAIGIDHQR